MPADTFTWLHLTDLHCGLKGHDLLDGLRTLFKEHF